MFQLYIFNKLQNYSEWTLNEAQSLQLTKTIKTQIETINAFINKFAYQNGEGLPLILKQELEPEVWFQFATNKFIPRRFEIKQECVECKKIIDVKCILLCEGNRRCRDCNNACNHSCACDEILQKLRKGKKINNIYRKS